jgi:hypothetical protein
MSARILAKFVRHHSAMVRALELMANLDVSRS